MRNREDRIEMIDPRPKVFAQKIVAGESMRSAMLGAGYSEGKAARGKAAISNKMLKALVAEGYKMAEFGKSFSLDEVKNVAMGRLITNAITGKDGGVMSAKTLGSHRELNLWLPETMTGVIVLQMPSSMVENKDKLLAAEENEAEQDHDK